MENNNFNSVSPEPPVQEKQQRFNFGMKDTYNKYFGENMEMTDAEREYLNNQIVNYEKQGFDTKKATEYAREDVRRLWIRQASNSREKSRKDHMKKCSMENKAFYIYVILSIILMGLFMGLYFGHVWDSDFAKGWMVGASVSTILLFVLWIYSYMTRKKREKEEKAEMGETQDGGKYRRALRQSVGNSLETSMFLPGFN